MATLIIDGKTLEFSKGESVIQAATRHDIEIPHYCWHPRLSVAANCRMCLVEVEKAPKLVPACQTECREGMTVHTANPRVRAAQRSVSEFLLINHPIDCPICDQAGECKLQDYYMKYQLAPSRMRERKVHKQKLTQLGPNVMYNAERCIVCTRCVRFMEEIPKERQLGVVGRGDHSVIGTAPGQPLDSAYSLNTVDVCPVGALTSTRFRFKQRVWNLRRSPSLCPGCAKGCNVQVDQRSQQVYRLLPRENEAVNKSWLCDEGRLTYNRANEDRLTTALVWARPPAPGDVNANPSEEIDATYEVTPDVALARALTQLRTGDATGTATVLLSMHATNEEAFVWGRLARDALGAKEIALCGYPDGDADQLLRHADKNPNRAGILKVMQGLGLKVLDIATLERHIRSRHITRLVAVGHESDALDGLVEAARSLDALVHVTFARSPLCAVADATLPGTSWVEAEGTWLSGEARMQTLHPAFPPAYVSRPMVLWAQDLAQGLGASFKYASIATLQDDLVAHVPEWSDGRLTDVGPLGRDLSTQLEATSA